jgi:hypothetical protein
MRKQLASALPYLNARNQLLENQGGETENDQSSTWKMEPQRIQEEDVVKGYVSTGITFTTRNLAGSCTRTETSLG